MSIEKFYYNSLENFINKSRYDFTREDLIKFIEQKQIQCLNFHYVGGDGRLKTLNFPVQNKKQLDLVLSCGERVDGSSLFKHVETGASDLYVVPKYYTAFENPFSEIPTLGIICRYFGKDGLPMESTPDNILYKADKSLKEEFGITMHAMGELEYYVISPRTINYCATDQRGYHESSPFTKWNELREKSMVFLTQMGCRLKYAHSEVGNFSDEENTYEQNELEFLPVDVVEAAEELVLAKWVLRNLAYKMGVTLSFAPKITVGKAGSGLHIHIKLLKEGKSIMGNAEEISEDAIKAIAGILYLSPSLTAFGNTVPTSYLRLVPHQEAPTNICWGYRNRSAMIRIPLGWTGEANNMITIANNGASPSDVKTEDKRTFEVRFPDGSADVYLLLAGLTVAVREGFAMNNAIEYAKQRFVDVNIFKDENIDIKQKLETLPNSCDESAEFLMKQKDTYKKHGVFDDSIIKGTYEKLKAYQDKGLSEKLYQNKDEIRKLVNTYIYC